MLQVIITTTGMAVLCDRGLVDYSGSNKPLATPIFEKLPVSRVDAARWQRVVFHPFSTAAVQVGPSYSVVIGRALVSFCVGAHITVPLFYLRLWYL